MSKDLITVALPVFNNEKTLNTTIKSILKQTYKNWELIIINDASTDNSAKIIKKFKDKRIKLITHKKNKHIATSLNEAIKIASGKYFARIDGDDYCYPQRFQKQLEFMKKNPEIDLVGCNMIVVDENGKLLGKRRFKKITNDPYANIYIAHPTFFGKTSFFRKYKYRCPPVTAQDQDLLFRAYKESKFANIDEILVVYQESLKWTKITKSRINLLKSRLIVKHVNFHFLYLVFSQFTKMIIDGIAISTGLRYKILTHRASKLSKKELKDWLNVKRELGIKT